MRKRTDRMSEGTDRRRIAFFGGSFDPVHIGHTEIARTLTSEFDLDVFLFVPAYHAPHKRDSDPASAFHRFAMLALATYGIKDVGISTIELEDPEHPYTIETMEKVKNSFRNAEIFFIIGADSWTDVATWRRWDEVLTATNIIVVTRPGFDIDFSHVTDEIRERIVDLRGKKSDPGAQSAAMTAEGDSIFITDAVNRSVSASEIRRMIRKGVEGWEQMVPAAAASHINKYGLYR